MCDILPLGRRPSGRGGAVPGAWGGGGGGDAVGQGVKDDKITFGHLVERRANRYAV